MIVAHLPAGYVVSKLVFPRFASLGTAYKPFMWAGAIGAIAPDLDMFYFYLVDHRQHHHHSYFSHFPVVWAGLLLISASWLYFGRTKRYAALAAIFSFCGLMHLVLDGIVGDVWWLAPFVDKSYALISVPAAYDPRWLNFILHWSFALELAIVAWAVHLWRKSANGAVEAASGHACTR